MPHRTTLTLQDDVYAAALEESRRSGRRLRDVINEALRRGLEATDVEPAVTALRTFSAEPILDLVSTGAQLEAAEGADHR